MSGWQPFSLMAKLQHELGCHLSLGKICIICMDTHKCLIGKSLVVQVNVKQHGHVFSSGVILFFCFVCFVFLLLFFNLASHTMT